MRGGIKMKKLKKLCGAVLIAGFMIPQIALGSTDTAEAASGKWKQDGKKWWYSYSDGTYPKSKWEKIGGKWYHFDKSGYMQTGWQKISGKWYYFNDSGLMQTGTIIIDGKSYTFDKNGVWINNTSGGSSDSSLSKAKVGDYVTFGEYEQDNNLSNGKEAIRWKVLVKEEGRMLLISEFGLDAKPYNNSWKNITWEKCTLRNWLNNEFYNAAFSAEEKSMIRTTIVENEDNPRSEAKGGNNTKDKLFILSLDEAIKYFKLEAKTNVAFTYYENDLACCKPTKYAVEQGALDYSWEGAFGIDSEQGKEYMGNCSWWLRTPGSSMDCMLDVYANGCVTPGASSVNDDSHAVRPALWVSAGNSSEEIEEKSPEWNKDSKGWWYSLPDGSYAKDQWIEIQDVKYYFNKWGYMQTGWKKITGKWYYFGSDGIMRRWWKKISGHYYYFGDNGAMKTGWQQCVDYKWYYFNKDGTEKTGWFKSQGKWYYSSETKGLVTGLCVINNRTYEFAEDGTWISNSVNNSAYETDYPIDIKESRKVLTYINDFRKSSGAWYWNADNKTKTYCNGQELKYSKELEKVAALRAKECIVQWTHERPDGRKNSTAFKDVGCNLNFAGECLFLEGGGWSTDAESVIDDLKEDNYHYDGQGHRRVMLGNKAKYVGAVCVYYSDSVNNETKTYWVLEFGY